MVLRHEGRKHDDPKPPKPPKVEPPVTTPALISPTGKISGAPANNGVDWANINQYDASYAHWGQHFGIDPNLCKRMTVVESGGKNIQGGQAGSTGILQIMPAYWNDTARWIGVSLATPDGQIAVCCAILSGWSGHGDYGSPEANFRKLYFPHDDPITGITQDEYWAWVAGTTPAPKPKPKPKPEKPVDPIAVIVGTKSYTIISDFKEPTSLPYYAYFEGHGGHANQHTGLDVQTTLGQALYACVAGTVVCGGTGVGAGAYGSSCAAFPDQMGRGAGRVEILAADGTRSLILGHCSRALVSPGQTVSVGTKVAEAGGMNSYHVHVEARLWANGDYTIVDPRTVFGGGALPEVYDTVDYDLWASNGNVYLVTPSRKTNCFQRADNGAQRLGSVEAGETVEAVARVVGQDGAEWWLLKDRRRCPVAATSFTTKVLP